MVLLSGQPGSDREEPPVICFLYVLNRVQDFPEITFFAR